MTILFIHGLASSGAFKTSASLRSIFRPCEVIAPDVPIDPDEAFNLLQGICSKEQPDLIVGLSLGGFWAQKLRGHRKILINPDFHVSRLLRTMEGTVEYLSPRSNGEKTFTITPEICDGYQKLEEVQFDGLTKKEKELTFGMFADADEIVDCRDEFEFHYPSRSMRYPGRHLPVHPELQKYLPEAYNNFVTVENK